MSRGTHITTLRLHPFVRQAVLDHLKQFNARSKKRIETITSFIEKAIVEKLKHLERSAKRRPVEEDSSNVIDLADLEDCFTPSQIPHVMGEEVK
jgi:hypothetical protein